MANEDRWREDRDRYRSDEQRRGREDRERWAGRGGAENRDWPRGSEGGQYAVGDDDYGRRGSEGRMAYGREGSADIYGRERDAGSGGGGYAGGSYGGGGGREGFWGRGEEGRGYSREGGRAYSREDYGASGYGGGYGREYYGGSFSRTGEEGRGGQGYGSQRRADYDEIGQGASGRSFVGNEGRGFGYGSDYGRGGGGGAYGGSRSGGEDYGREGYGARGGRQERGFFERAADEVSSWFGDRDAGQRREQDYRGRGPKGYKRSDQRMQEDVNDRLSDDPYVDASEVDVSVSNGEVTLSGTVDSRSARRRAEDLAEQVSGVSYVQNNLRVRQSQGMGGSTGMGSTSTAAGSTSGMGATGASTGSTGSTGTSGSSVASGMASSSRTGSTESDTQRRS
jgi:osmotically-inducible protein OsmY